MEQTRFEKVRHIFNSAAFISNLGLELESAGQGTCETTLVIKPEHLQQDGFVHAGVQATIADHTAGAAAGSQMPPDHIVLTSEFKINFLRPAKGERLVCKGRVIKPGRRLMAVEAEVYCIADTQEKLVSKMLGTIAVVPDPSG